MQKLQRGRAARPRIVIASGEHARLMALADKAVEQNMDTAEFLLEELTRAFVVPDGKCADNVVRVGSRVTYREESTSRIRRVTLSYPRDANIEHNRISILTPIGAALIGLSIAQTIEWPTPDGRTDAITVLDVANDSIPQMV
jgi:regulator of nucleoside diphosphate kinase